jgi:hypothetical protein
VTPDTEPNDASRHAARRKAVEALAAAVRRLGDVAVETDVDPAEIDAVTRDLVGLTERLGRRVDTTHYSGLTGPEPDYSTPEGPMPLNPIIGACSPVRPDVSVWTTDDGVRGRAVLSKRFVGEHARRRRPVHHEGVACAVPATPAARRAARARRVLPPRRRHVPRDV